MAWTPFVVPVIDPATGKPKQIKSSDGTKVNELWVPLVLQASTVMVDPDLGQIKWVSGMNIDVDGTGPAHGDPYYQSDTTLHNNGKPLNADVDLYLVVPPQIILYAERNLRVASAVVLGCAGQVFHRINRKTAATVVGDVGPKTKIGEASRATALAIGVNGDPVRGGESSHVIEYTITPGKPAPGYALQPYGKH